jgi:site-specific DNA-methyltransferase (adenine-specific)
VQVDQRVEEIERDGADPHAAQGSGAGWIVQGENLDVLRALPDGCVELAYVDPPFNTGRRQTRPRLRTRRAAPGESGDRTGFGGRRYATEVVGESSFDDRFDDFPAFLEPRLVEARRVLAADGSLFVHVDPRESHYVKVLLDRLFGRASFMNEIVWAYDYGARSRTRWPAKHDTILWYAKDPARYVFDYDAIDRIPYAAPDLVGPEKAARGKTPTDVWWQTIVPTNSRERTGYATQKPLAILRRIVAVHSRPGGLVLDFFAGSGTTGEAAARLGRRFLLVDSSPEAVRVMAKRLAFAGPKTLTQRQFVAARGPVLACPT